MEHPRKKKDAVLTLFMHQYLGKWLMCGNGLTLDFKVLDSLGIMGGAAA